jgi:predicted membrane protein
VIALMGGCKLDLRRVTISGPLTVIRAYVVMGNVNVIVPEGVEVELDGLAVMGSRSLKLKGAPAQPGAPVVRIEGLVLMGDLTVRDRP